MIYSSPAAEVRIPTGLARNGERSWRWMELGLQIPYFLVSLQTITEDIDVVRHLLFGHLRDVLDLASQQSASFKVLNLGLLSPGYMNGTERYQLGQVREIWSAKGRGQPNLFVMEDGTKLRFDVTGEPSDDLELELVLAL